MTDQEKNLELEVLANLLEAHGMSDLAWNRRNWICTEGHPLSHYRRLRTGRLCPEKSEGTRCTGRVTHPPLHWFTVEDALWEAARRWRWTVAFTSYCGGIGYQWVVNGHQVQSKSKVAAATTALFAALRDDREES